jgi:hypothetical protein
MSNLKKYLDIYKTTVKLPGSGEQVEISPLTTNDIKKLLVYEDQPNFILGEKIMDDILLESTESKIDIHNMYLNDRYFLFLEIRKITKGTEYSFQISCPQCGNQSVQTIDLNKIKVNTAVNDRESEVKILDDKITLHLDYVTRKEQFESFKELNLEGMNERQQRVELELAQFALHVKKIVTPEGEEKLSFKDKIEFLGELKDSEFEGIQE